MREPHPTRNPLLRALRWVGLALFFALVGAAPTRAQDRIILSEVLPILEGSDLGALEIAVAPPPGSTRVVRRSEILAALQRSGHDARGLQIPRSVRIRRQARELDSGAIEALVRPVINRHLSPCEIGEIRVPSSLTIGQGDVAVTTEMRRPTRNTSSVSGMFIFTAGNVTRRINVRAQVTCPPPAVQPGSRVTVIAQVGNVRASAPGEARQPGRVGDIIRVHTIATRTTLLARVMSSNTVLVVR